MKKVEGLRRFRLIKATPKTRDRERAVIPTILYTSQKEDWGDVKGKGFALMVGWWAWGIGFLYIKATPTQRKDK